MPKSFLIKKILGLDDDQSVPTLKVEDSCEEFTLDDQNEHRKKSPCRQLTANISGGDLLHYPEFLNKSIAFQSYLFSHKYYFPALPRGTSYSSCSCNECLSASTKNVPERSLLPFYPHPFIFGHGPHLPQRGSEKSFNTSHRKRPYAFLDSGELTTDFGPKSKLPAKEKECGSVNSPPALVPELKKDSRGSTPVIRRNQSVRLEKIPEKKEPEVDNESSGCVDIDESLDGFSIASSDCQSSYSSGSRRGSDVQIEDKNDGNGTGNKKKEFSCSNCPMTFARSSDLQRHSLIHSKEKPYVCYICDRGFTWFGNFQKHVLSHDGDYKVYHPLLFMKNTSEEDLILREGNNFKCKLCQKQFTRMSGLRTHVRMHTGQRPFKCSACSFAFTTSRALKMHMRIHTGERPYKCDECPKAFTRRDELQAHIYMHKGEKPFKCDQCSSAFIRYGHLQRHLLTHSADKPYKCKWCTKSFTQYRNLQTHTYKHTGERPFKCNFCGKGFTQYGTLQAHERTHTGTKPFQCKECDKAFITSSHLRWHMKRHHGDDKIDLDTTNVE